VWATRPTSSNYDVTADGQRFLMIKDSDTEVFPSQINVVLNWSEELKRLASEGRKGHDRPESRPELGKGGMGVVYRDIAELMTRRAGVSTGSIRGMSP
jgi:hypothetical protein